MDESPLLGIRTQLFSMHVHYLADTQVNNVVNNRSKKIKDIHMKMSKVWAILALFTMWMSMSPASAASIIFGNDLFKFTGDTYIDVSGADTQGIGRVSTITQGANVIWASGQGGEYLNFTFGNFSPVVAPVAPVFNYVASGGYVDFYTTTIGALFNTSATVASEMSAIAGGSLFLHTVANGFTVGIGTPVTYSASGFLDVISGPYATQLNTNTRPTFAPGVFADLSFGLVGANNQNPLVNPDYEYISSADAQGASVVTIPEPGSLLLLGLGFIAFSVYGKKRTVNDFHGSAMLAA